MGNFPGVTVDQKVGEIKEHKNCSVVDLPGIYSLRPYTSEEIVTRDFLINEKPDAIINIVDATNIERNLYLTLQLLEMQIPMVLALNMMDEVRKSGVHILNNASTELTLHGEKFCISGLEIPLECYGKGSYEPLPEHFIQEALGEAKKDAVQILLAHNPMFAKEYADWGADITVCGHTHGGLVRIPGIGSVISPQFELFPKYDAGEFEFDGKKVYVSKGLGTHTFHIRVFDRAEVLMIRINKM